MVIFWMLFSKYFAKEGLVSSSNQREGKINWQLLFQQTNQGLDTDSLLSPGYP